MNREATMVQLALATGYNVSAYEKMTDEELEKELERLFGGGKDDWIVISSVLHMASGRVCKCCDYVVLNKRNRW